MTSRNNYASTPNLMTLNATGKLMLQNKIKPNELPPRKTFANFMSTQPASKTGDVFAVGEIDRIIEPKVSTASNGQYRSGGICKTMNSQGSFIDDDLASNDLKRISSSDDGTPYLEQESGLDGPENNYFECERPGCTFNERTIVEQNEYIVELESRVSELENKLIRKTGKLELLKRQLSRGSSQSKFLSNIKEDNSYVFFSNQKQPASLTLRLVAEQMLSYLATDNQNGQALEQLRSLLDQIAQD